MLGGKGKSEQAAMVGKGQGSAAHAGLPNHIGISYQIPLTFIKLKL